MTLTELNGVQALIRRLCSPYTKGQRNLVGRDGFEPP